MASIKTDAHPKNKHSWCLSNNSLWQSYQSAENKLSVDDVAMMLCRDSGMDFKFI